MVWNNGRGRLLWAGLILLLICTLYSSVSAWWPEEGYHTIADLQLDIQMELPMEWEYKSGMRGGDVIFVQMETPDEWTAIYIFRKQNDKYRLEQHGFLLPRQDGVKGGIGCSDGKELYVEYQNNMFDWCGTFRHIGGGVWMLSVIQSKDVIKLTGLGLEYCDTDWHYLYGTPRFDIFLDPDHPIDMNIMPTSIGEACALMDTDGWAIIDIPYYDVQANLRAELSLQSSVLGQYFGGTPVRVLEDDPDTGWVHVRIGGAQEGYILRSSLTFGRDMGSVLRRFPSRIGNSLRYDLLDAGSSIPIFNQPDTDSSIAYMLDAESIIGKDIMDVGTYGNDWRIVTLGPDGPFGYVEKKWFWPGNG